MRSPTYQDCTSVRNGDLVLNDVVIVGAGYTGLAAAFELCRKGYKVVVLEKDGQPGGLAGSFAVGGQRLEKFYHHWFTSDFHVFELIRRLGHEADIIKRPTNTGMYYAQNFFKLSSPKDVLTFSPLTFVNRLRLAFSVLAARRVKDWRSLEGYTAKEWLLRYCGKEVYRVVWEPLLVGKFGDYAEQVSAVWFWNKLKLRGGSRDTTGQEVLAYYKGGFAALADELVQQIERDGGTVLMNTPVSGLEVSNGKVAGVRTPNRTLPARLVLLTVPLPTAADLMTDIAPRTYTQSLRRVLYLSNICIVLQLSQSLSSVYWLNVNDPGFPFVAVVEHTNFAATTSYGGKHVVYLSKYLPSSAALYRLPDEDAILVGVEALQKMFPQFEPRWIISASAWRADYAQPIIERHYSRLIPDVQTPIDNLLLATMAQIYPEDRGTNYAVRSGFQATERIETKLLRPSCL